MKLLVVGRGLLGNGIVRCALHDDLHPNETIDWSAPAVARDQLARMARSFAGSVGDTWRVAWCAGAGVVGTSDAQFLDEQSYLETFLDALAGAMTVAAAGRGGLFFASSAGGVFGAGSSEAITELSPETPVSAYGESKLV
ncbi:MAG TPA: hypothetical protein VGC84_09155, partial [Ilumatobacteraceae bacterium]